MAEFKQNEIYFGFRLQKIEEINDIHSTAYLFSHEKSGARLLYLKNADHNKVFNVAFKTPPENDWRALTVPRGSFRSPGRKCL